MRPRCSRPLVGTLVVLVGLASAMPVASADDLAEFIGRSDQSASTITHYGYVTHVSGFADAALFFDPVNRTEATAPPTCWPSTFAPWTVSTLWYRSDSVATGVPWANEDGTLNVAPALGRAKKVNVPGSVAVVMMFPSTCRELSVVVAK